MGEVPVRQRQERIYQRAHELAASGVHINPITVVTALVQEGYSEAAELLNNEILRADLRDVCTRHWRGVAVDQDEPSSEPQTPTPDIDIDIPNRNAKE